MADEILPNIRYANLLEAVEAVQVLIDKVSGKKAYDLHCVIKAAYALEGYGLSQLADHPQVVVTTTFPGDIAASLHFVQNHLKSLEEGKVAGWADFPWLMVIDLIRKIVEDLTK